FVGGFSFERLHELGDREVGRHGYEEMDMILGNRTLDDFHIFNLAYLSQKIPESFRYLSIQHFLSVFCNPDQVVLEVIHRMRSCPVVLHLLILLKSSPKRRGVFSPKETLIRPVSACDEQSPFFTCFIQTQATVLSGVSTSDFFGLFGASVEVFIELQKLASLLFRSVTSTRAGFPRLRGV